MKPHSISFTGFCLWLSVLFCATVTVIEFQGVPVSDMYSLLTTAMQFGAVCLATAGLLCVIALWRTVFAIVFPLLMAVCGTMCYFNLSIGIRLTATSIEVAAINGADMWSTMISPGLVLAVLLSLCVGVAAAVVRIKYVRTDRRQCALIGSVGLILVLVPTVIVNRLKAPVGGRLPYSIYYAVSGYLGNLHDIAAKRVTFDAVEVMPDSVAAPDVILVLGESLRADHLPFNGYGRNTMPLMSEESNLISFPSTCCEYTYTDPAVARILTRADSSNPEPAYTEQSFITLFKRAGYATAWFANQDLSRSYAYFAHEADTTIYCNAARSLYSYEKWLDSDITSHFGKWYGDTAQRQLAVIHTIGSHWWYPTHYTDEDACFHPEVTHKDVGGLSQEAMINSYDNTIVATDRFLHDIVERLRRRNAVMLFVSDHGEALGEDGVFLHASETDVLHRPAVFIWYSDNYKRNFPHIIDGINSERERELSTDSIFPLILKISRLKAEI